MSSREIKVGDRVMCTDDGNLGVVTFVDIDEGKGINNGYEVKFDDGSEEWIATDMLVLSDEPPYDKRMDFLTRLGSLLREFNAEIEVEQTGYDSMPKIVLCADGGRESAYYSAGTSITADNIMDFEKE